MFTHRIPSWCPTNCVKALKDARTCISQLPWAKQWTVKAVTGKQTRNGNTCCWNWSKRSSRLIREPVCCRLTATTVIGSDRRLVWTRRMSRDSGRSSTCSHQFCPRSIYSRPVGKHSNVNRERWSVPCSQPRTGSGVVRIDPPRFLAGCRKMRLNQALSVLSRSVRFHCVAIYYIIYLFILFIRAPFMYRCFGLLCVLSFGCTG